jgi:hypothetical protein
MNVEYKKSSTCPGYRKSEIKRKSNQHGRELRKKKHWYRTSITWPRIERGTSCLMQWYVTSNRCTPCASGACLPLNSGQCIGEKLRTNSKLARWNRMSSNWFASYSDKCWIQKIQRPG